MIPKRKLSTGCFFKTAIPDIEPICSFCNSGGHLVSSGQDRSSMEEELVALRQARRGQMEEEVGPLYSTRQVT